MFKVLIVVTAGGNYGETKNISLTTTVVEFDTAEAAVAAANAINRCTVLDCSAVCLW